MFFIVNQFKVHKLSTIFDNYTQLFNDGLFTYFKIKTELNDYLKFLKILIVAGHIINPYIFRKYFILKMVTYLFVIKLINLN